MAKLLGKLCTISVLVISSLLASPAQPVVAQSLSKAAAVMEKVLREAQALIEKDEPDRDELRKAMAILSAYHPRFPQEPRFPLYLAEAQYKLADSAAPIDREFPLYEKAGMYAAAVLKLDPKRTEGHYWYGLYLLKKAQKIGGMRAYFPVRRGIKELETVRALLPAYDHSGASRVLALLYGEAPGWTPFGDVNKAVRLGEEAVRIDPSYPPNHLCLADAYYKRGDKGAAVREYRKVLALPAHAKGDREKARQMLVKLGVATPK